jgi:hypothetical protein
MARRYVRDNRGRFASAGSGATARGGRLRTAAGNKRATQTQEIKGSRSAGTIGKPKGLKPQSGRELRTGVALNRAKTINARMSGGVDTAAANVAFKGTRGRRLDADINASVKQQKTQTRTADKARNKQFKSDQSKAKALRDRYGDAYAKDFAARQGKSVSEVKAAIKSLPPSQQVRVLTQGARKLRAEANVQRTMAAQPASGSRRLSKAQVRSQLRADTARDIYAATGSKRAQIIRNQAGLARTERAKQNQMRTRQERLAEAQKTGLPMITVSGRRGSYKPAANSQAAIKIEQAKGRVKQFTQAKKSVDSQVRQVRQQIKEARSNAMTFGAVPGLKLKLVELQGKSKEYKMTIEKARQASKG